MPSRAKQGKRTAFHGAAATIRPSVARGRVLPFKKRIIPL
jgi:hypothetical protein